MPRVLIVDDAAFMRMTIRTMLERHGFEIVAEADNGALGVQKYKQYKPDIVTMDITMQVMSGIEATQKIKDFDPEAKVIILSAMGQEAMVKDAILSGAKTFIVKPFNEELLVQTMKKILQLK